MTIREELAFVGTCDISGQVRGKGIPAVDLPARRTRGVGWTPTNTMITVFGVIGETPFGPFGDVMLMPDPKAEVRVDFGDGGPPEHFALADVRNTDGTPWSCCPREFLRRALALLEHETGLHLLAAFEQEFVYTAIEDAIGNRYSLDAFRRQGAFGETFVAALREAGAEPESFLAEYGRRQFEVTCAPALGMAAADRAVIIRELARASAGRLGQRAVFSPILDHDGVGNGVHIHLSFRDAAGRPATRDPQAPYGLTEVARSFMAGLLHHMSALCAVTAPSVISYIRLTPNRWAPTVADIAVQDREASLRVCPVFETPESDLDRQCNVEFRPADAAASPYLALGAIVQAGLDGIRKRLALPAAGAAHAKPAARPLPRSLGEALEALEATPEAGDWFGPALLDAYLKHKRSEIRIIGASPPEEQCRRYALAY